MATEKDLENRETLIWEENGGPLEDFRMCGIMLGYKYFVGAFYETDRVEVAAICKDQNELAEIFCDFSGMGMFCRVEMFVAKNPQDFELN